MGGRKVISLQQPFGNLNLSRRAGAYWFEAPWLHLSTKAIDQLYTFGSIRFGSAGKHLQIKDLVSKDGMLTAGIYLAKAGRTETLRNNV